MKSTTGIIGYFFPLSVQPKNQTELKISSKLPSDCTVEVLRVICADIDPNGPGENTKKFLGLKNKK